VQPQARAATAGTGSDGRVDSVRAVALARRAQLLRLRVSRTLAAATPATTAPGGAVLWPAARRADERRARGFGPGARAARWIQQRHVLVLRRLYEQHGRHTHSPPAAIVDAQPHARAPWSPSTATPRSAPAAVRSLRPPARPHTRRAAGVLAVLRAAAHAHALRAFSHVHTPPGLRRGPSHRGIRED
ncbi:hypothetical protein LPJ57_005769, partial [Coemansia sp. RSA 486]